MKAESSRFRGAAKAWERLNGRILAVSCLVAVAIQVACIATSVPKGLLASEPTSAAGCVIKLATSERHLMLGVLHRTDYGVTFSPPAGGIETEELRDPRLTAKRETFEETGYKVRVGRELARILEGQTIFHVYHCWPQGRENLPVKGEVVGIAFLDPEEIPDSFWRFPSQAERLKEIFLMLDGEAVGLPVPPDGFFFIGETKQ